MLLTSSQVSIALSSGIVILFTTALFLSGYAIQQRTLRDLRAAIKPSPRPEPKIFLPDRFKKSTTELPDGTVIEVEDGNHRGSQKPIRGTKTQQRGTGNNQKGFVVEVKPTLPEEAKGRTAHVEDKKGKGKKEGDGKNKKKTAKQDTKQQRVKSRGQAQVGGKQAPTAGKEGLEQQQKKSRPPGPDSVPHPEDGEVLVSRAERRRLIKQELRKLSEGTERGYWQRRLW